MCRSLGQELVQEDAQFSQFVGEFRRERVGRRTWTQFHACCFSCEIDMREQALKHQHGVKNECRKLVNYRRYVHATDKNNILTYLAHFWLTDRGNELALRARLAACL